MRALHLVLVTILHTYILNLELIFDYLTRLTFNELVLSLKYMYAK
jgi:hypothetical protein